MVGTPLLASWLAQLAFWTLLAIGWFSEELSLRTIGICVLLWFAGFFGLNDAFFFPCVAILDIVLVLLVFKGDVQLR